MAELRVPEFYEQFHLDFLHNWRFLVREDLDDAFVGVALDTAYASVKMAIYVEGAALALDVVTGTVKTAAADQYAGVNARVEFAWTPASGTYTAGTAYRVVVFGVTSTPANEVLGQAWVATARTGPPTSTS